MNLLCFSTSASCRQPEPSSCPPRFSTRLAAVAAWRCCTSTASEGRLSTLAGISCALRRSIVPSFSAFLSTRARSFLPSLCMSPMRFIDCGISLSGWRALAALADSACASRSASLSAAIRACSAASSASRTSSRSSISRRFSRSAASAVALASAAALRASRRARSVSAMVGSVSPPSASRVYGRAAHSSRGTALIWPFGALTCVSSGGFHSACGRADTSASGTTASVPAGSSVAARPSAGCAAPASRTATAAFCGRPWLSTHSLSAGTGAGAAEASPLPRRARRRCRIAAAMELAPSAIARRGRQNAAQRMYPREPSATLSHAQPRSAPLSAAQRQPWRV